MWALAIFVLGTVAWGDMPLLALEFEVDVAGPLAEVVVHQTFRNDSDDFLEATYLFPLHPGAAVDGVDITIGDRTIHGMIAEKKAAREAYQQAVDQGHVAALTETEGSHLFRQHVGNIPPHSEVVVELLLVQPLDRYEGQWELVLPLTHTPRFALDADDHADTTWVAADDLGRPRVSVDVHAVTGVPIREASSPSHAMHIQRFGPELVASLDSVSPGRDVVVRWRTATDEPVVGFLVAGDHALLTLEPPRRSRLEERVPRELVWVVDQSGSMSGAPLELTKRAMLAALELLDERDSFTVIGFSKTLRAWSDGPVPATRSNRDRAAAWVSDLVAGGGTRLDRAVSAALQMPGDLGRQRVVVFVTDGAISFEDQVYDEIIAADTDATLVTVGVGSAPHRGLLDELAELGGGRSIVLPLDADAEPAMEALMVALDRPVMTAAHLRWSGWQPEEVWPRRLPDLHVEEPTYVVLRLGGVDGGPVWFDGSVGPDRVQRVLYPQFVDAERALRSSFGHAKVTDLYRRARRGLVPDVDALVLQTALEYAIVTPTTSFVAIEQGQVRNPGGQRVVRGSTTRLPDGVSGDTVDNTRQGSVLTKDHLDRVPAGRSYQQAVQMAAGVTGGASHDELELDGSIEEVIVVSRAEGVEVESTSLSTVLTQEYLDRVPAGRSYQTAVQLGAGGSPGTPPTSGGGAQSTFMLDGANITDPTTGTFSINFNFDAIEQIEVLTGGLMPEVPGTTDRVVNLVTQTGTNNVEARFGVAHVGGAGTELSADWATGSVSGPVVRDRMWLAGSYGFDRSAIPGRDFDGHTGFAKLTVQPNSEFRLFASAGHDTASIDLESADVNQDSTHAHVRTQWFLSPEVNVDVALWGQRQDVQADARRRLAGKATATLWAVEDPVGGTHNLKAGVDVDRMAWDIESTVDWIDPSLQQAGASRVGGFAQDSWMLDRVTVNGGARVDIALGRAHLGPRLYAAWDPFDDERTKLSAGFGRAFGQLGLPAVAVVGDTGLPRLDELVATVERELVRDLILGGDASLRLRSGLPTALGQQADRQTWVTRLYLRRVPSRRWSGHLDYSRTWLQGELSEPLLATAGLEAFTHAAHGAVSWSLPTDPWTLDLGVVGAVYAAPLGEWVPVPGQPLVSGERWSAGFRAQQHIDVRKGRVVVHGELSTLALLAEPTDLGGLLAVQPSMPELAGFEGARVEAGMTYSF